MNESTNGTDLGGGNQSTAVAAVVVVAPPPVFDHHYPVVGGGSAIDDGSATGHLGLISNPAVQVVFYILYTTIFVIGVFGNVLVCYVVLRNKAMQSVTNFFITNLALSDILLCVLAVPFTPLYSFLGQWVFGTVLCHLVPFSQGVSVYISTLTLTSIAVDRFFVIIYPFKKRMRLGTSLAIICSIWAFSVLATLPYGIFTQLEEVADTGGQMFCEENWPNESSRHIFSASTTVMQFVVPFVIIAFCYVRVSIRLSDRARLKPGAKSSRKEELDRERKRRTNRMLIAMVAIFGCSWLPLNLVNLMQDVFIDFSAWEYTSFLFFIAHAIAMSSTCYNPFLYAWLNENFRKEFKQVLPRFAFPSSGDGGGGSMSLNCRSAGVAAGGGSARNRAAGRPASHRAVDKSCNGNDTVQETLLTTMGSLSTVKVHVTQGQDDRDDGPQLAKVLYDTPTETVAMLPATPMSNSDH